MKIFGISGKMGAGKDTIGDLVSERLGNVAKIAYADGLREEIQLIINKYKDIEKLPLYMKVEREEAEKMLEILEGVDSIYERGEKQRLAMQYWGTDVRRKLDSNYWINIAMIKARYEINKGNFVYITDARFENEVKAIEVMGGKVIRIEIPDEVRVERLIQRDGVKPCETSLTHSSEISLDNYDFKYKINGEESLEKLANECIEIIRRK